MRFEGFPYVQKPPVIADQSGYIGKIVINPKTAIFVSTNHHTAAVPHTYIASQIDSQIDSPIQLIVRSK